MTIISISSVIAILVYSCFTFLLIRGIFRIRKGGNSEKTRISIIIAAHNEAGQISDCLTSLLKQSYPEALIEIIVVNDRSDDQTAEQIAKFKKAAKNIRSINIYSVPEGISPKKFALNAGIQQATGEIIFTTDADCRVQQNWLHIMVKSFDKDIGAVTGPAPFQNGSYLLRQYQNTDHLASTLVSAGGAGWNTGITCTGRNFAYRKKAFEQVNGFQSFHQSLSGDDDLLLQAISKKTSWKITCVLDKDVAVVSDAASGLWQYIRQRRRHISAGKYYTFPLKAAYLAYNAANTILFLFFILSLITLEMVSYATSLLIIKLMFDYFALAILARKLQHTFNIFHLLLWEIGFFLNQLIIGPAAFFGRLRWK